MENEEESKKCNRFCHRLMVACGKRRKLSVLQKGDISVKKYLIVLCLLLLCGCSAPQEAWIYLEEEAVALAETPPAVSLGLVPQQGSQVKQNDRAAIDWSNTAEGYVMVRVARDSGRRWKALVKGPATTYTYNLTPEQWTVFPLSDGSGDYQIGVYENISGTKYAVALAHTCTVQLKDAFAPFLYPNQYVNYDKAPNTVAKAVELTAQSATALDKVAQVYDFVIKTLTYDRELAQTVTSGYLPDLEAVLEKKSGICFDYAALMAGMLRSQGVPCKLVVGYAGTVYHAWISVWTAEQGWIDKAIWFNGSTWQRMDPTFASGGKNSASILQYIGDGTNYTAKYFY